MMKNFSYTIKDEIGIHARPAGLLAKKAKNSRASLLLKRTAKPPLRPSLWRLWAWALNAATLLTLP